jgi:hypothetical protein
VFAERSRSTDESSLELPVNKAPPIDWCGLRIGVLKFKLDWEHQDQWRICFSFANGEINDVEITDYH